LRRAARAGSEGDENFCGLTTLGSITCWGKEMKRPDSFVTPALVKVRIPN
jgi:hypothetical protein